MSRWDAERYGEDIARGWIVDELNRDYPVPPIPSSATPPRRRYGRVIVQRTIYLMQGACLGLMMAIVFDQTIGLATPTPTMVSMALIAAWVWPDRKVLATRAVVARVVVCFLVAQPFMWWPR